MLYIVDTKLFAYFHHQRKGVAYDLFNSVASKLAKLEPGPIIFVGDRGKSSYRLNEQPYYKANRRQKMTDEERRLHAIFSQDYLNCLTLASHLRVKVVAPYGVEADDVASLIAARYRRERPDIDITFLTSDRDWLFNVIGTNSKILTADGLILDHDHVVETYGVDTQEDWVLLKSLAGDSGDNLKGPIKWFGAANAKKIMEQTKDLDEIVQHMEEHLQTAPRAELQALHLEHGRSDIRSMIESNMKVAAPFTDLSYLSPEQQVEFSVAMNTTPTPNLRKFMTEAIITFGAPITLSNAARKVYG